MGRGRSGLTNSVGASYQGKKGYEKANSSGYSADNMSSQIDRLPQKTIDDNRDAIGVIQRIAGNPDAKITIYRATIGDRINDGDWVFLDYNHADKWTRTHLGTKKPNVKVVQKTVKAKDVDWTGKNFEFMYNIKKKK